MLAVAGITAEHGRLLLVRDQHGFWAAGVGGFIEPGEGPEEALLREVREELGVEGEVGQALRPALFWHVDGDASFLLFLFRIRLLSHEFSPDPAEVSDVLWAGPEAWPALEMLPYVRALFEERLAEWLKGGG